MPDPARDAIEHLLARCTFEPGTAPLAVACSGGADSSALLILAASTGRRVVVHHVDHGARPDAAGDLVALRSTVARVDAELVVHRLDVTPGPNFEARARDARRAALPDHVATGHTADDQAETVLLNVLRGAGLDGLGAMRPGPRHPILGLRRHETAALCRRLGLDVATDPTNTDPRFRRNRVRHEVLPLLADVAERDVVPLLNRTAELARADTAELRRRADELDACDARAVRDAPVPLARRALRDWLTVDGYPPSAAAIDRVLAVARGERRACEIEPGRRVSRTGQRLQVEPVDRPAGR